MSNNTITETITDSITGAQAKAFDLLADSQETAVKALDSWTEFLTAQAKSFMPGSFEGFGVDMPAFGQVYETMPSPTEMIDKSFAVIEDMLAKQREFAIKLAASAEDMVPAASTAKTSKTTKK